MSTVKFLCDEDVRDALVAAVLRVDPAISITAVSEEDAPAKGALDPKLLTWAETNGYALISRDCSTMRGACRRSLGGRTPYLGAVSGARSPAVARDH